MWQILTLLALLSSANLLAANQLTFQAKIHRCKSAENRLLVDKLGSLNFDDNSRQLSFKSGAGDIFEIGYDAVTKVVFDVTTHMRGGALSQIISGVGMPGAIAGAAIAGRHVHDYWLYVDYNDGGHDREALLEVPKESSKEVIDLAQKCFGSKVTVSEIHQGQEIDTNRLPDAKSKQKLRVDKHNHPLPQTKPDKATIVVVCPRWRRVTQGGAISSSYMPMTVSSQ